MNPPLLRDEWISLRLPSFEVSLPSGLRKLFYRRLTVVVRCLWNDSTIPGFQIMWHKVVRLSGKETIFGEWVRAAPSDEFGKTSELRNASRGSPKSRNR